MKVSQLLEGMSKGQQVLAFANYLDSLKVSRKKVAQIDALIGELHDRGFEMGVSKDDPDLFSMVKAPWVVWLPSVKWKRDKIVVEYYRRAPMGQASSAHVVSRYVSDDFAGGVDTVLEQVKKMAEI